MKNSHQDDDEYASHDVTIEGETTPCGARTNDGDAVFQKVFERETGQDYAQSAKPNANANPIPIGAALRK